MFWLVLFCAGTFLFCVGLFNMAWPAMRLKGRRWEIPAHEAMVWLRAPGKWGGRRWLAWTIAGFLMMIASLAVIMP